MDQVQFASGHNITETIIKAMREEIWATNQMQLGAFMENNKATCPNAIVTDIPRLTDTTRSDPSGFSHEISAIILATCLILAFYLIWISLIFYAVYKRAHHYQARRQRSQRNS